jgi:hypothetical protein
MFSLAHQMDLQRAAPPLPVIWAHVNIAMEDHCTGQVNFPSSITEIEICGPRLGAGEPFTIWQIYPPSKKQTNKQKENERK